MFDGRSLEHVTDAESHELESFIEDLEYLISLKLHGAREVVEDAGSGKENDPNGTTNPIVEENDSLSSRSDSSWSTAHHPRPKQCEYI